MDQPFPTLRATDQNHPSGISSEKNLRRSPDAARPPDRIRQRRPSQNRPFESDSRANRPAPALGCDRRQAPSHLEAGQSPASHFKAREPSRTPRRTETRGSKNFEDLWREIGTTTTKGQTYGLTSTT